MPWCSKRGVQSWSKRGEISLSDGFSITFLAEHEPLVVLGTRLALQDATQHEVRNRIAAGWRSFWSMKSLLPHEGSSVKKRLRLFDSTVGSCVLCCAASWTPRVEELLLLRTARRAMLRRIVGQSRSPEETYVDWIQRVTNKAESVASAAGVRDWAVAHSKMKWNWAGHVARRPASTWVWRITTWRDTAWQALANESGAARPLRPSTRRWMKWEDALRCFCRREALGHWTDLAVDRETWARHADAFIVWFRLKLMQ